jgi:hypothetical protein
MLVLLGERHRFEGTVENGRAKNWTDSGEA